MWIPLQITLIVVIWDISKSFTIHFRWSAWNLVPGCLVPFSLLRGESLHETSASSCQSIYCYLNGANYFCSYKSNNLPTQRSSEVLKSVLKRLGFKYYYYPSKMPWVRLKSRALPSKCACVGMQCCTSSLELTHIAENQYVLMASSQ